MPPDDPQSSAKRLKTYNLDEEAPVETPHGSSILMLEDDNDFSAILSEFLVSYGFAVTRVINGAEGLKHIINRRFDVILCDMVMPGFPGDMFYMAVSRTRPAMLRRFIFMTGYQGDRKIDKFIRSIRGIVLWKPFQFHELLERINCILQKYPPVSIRKAA